MLPMRSSSVAGLFVAFGGMALLVSPASRGLGDPDRLLARVLGQLALWSLFAAILAMLGSYWAAALLVVPAFALVHYPLRGAGAVLTFLVSGAVAAALFVWSRNLTALIVCHVLVDGMGLVIAPLYTQWWKG